MLASFKNSLSTSVNFYNYSFILIIEFTIFINKTEFGIRHLSDFVPLHGVRFTLKKLFAFAYIK